MTPHLQIVPNPERTPDEKDVMLVQAVYRLQTQRETIHRLVRWNIIYAVAVTVLGLILITR